MSVRILRAGLDTLEVTFRGCLHANVLAGLEKLKAEAIAADGPVPYAVGVDELYLQPKAYGVWVFILSGRDFELRLSRSEKVDGYNASIRLSAYGLATTDPAQLYEYARLCLGDLGSFTEHGVSRADVAVDFQGHRPTLAEMTAATCPSSFRPILPNTERPETFQFGQGEVVLRVYDKTRQAKKKHKEWWFAVFEECEGYDPGESVWRCECQLRRKTLRELGVCTTEDVFTSAGALLDWTMQWAKVRVPAGDKKKIRWPEAEWWAELRQVNTSGRTLLRVRREAHLLELQQVFQRYVGLLAIAGAHYGDEDFHSVARRLHDDSHAHMMTKVRSFAWLVGRKRCRIGS